MFPKIKKNKKTPNQCGNLVVPEHVLDWRYTFESCLKPFDHRRSPSEGGREEKGSKGCSLGHCKLGLDKEELA